MKSNHIQKIEIRAAVITISSTRNPENDLSGLTIRSMLNAAGIMMNHYAIVPDRIDMIRDELFRAMKVSNCIIFNGGTGLTHDDCTIEAIAPLFEKEIEGFGEMFRLKSLAEIGTSSMLSRATAGILHGRAIFCIPGSTPAVTLATKELIIPEIAHILSHSKR